MSVIQILQEVEKLSKEVKKRLMEEAILELEAEIPPLQLIPSDLFVDLDKIFNQDTTFSDVKILAEDVVLKCHKAILSLR